MIALSFRQTHREIMVRAAATCLFESLYRSGAGETTLQELVDGVQYGHTASAAKENVGPKYVRITDLQDNSIDWSTVPFCECSDPKKYRLAENDLLFARTGATTGKTHLVKDPPDAVFASYLIRVRPKVGINPKYLHAFFQSDTYWRQIVEGKEGSAQPNVNGQKLLGLRISNANDAVQRGIGEFIEAVRARADGQDRDLPSLPRPLAEQRRIVARIEELAAKIDEARGLRHSSQEEAAMVTGAAARVVLSTFGGEASTRAPIGDIAEVRGGIQKGPHRLAGSNPVRYLTVAHVHRNRILLDDPRYFEVAPDELERWRLLAGDVLIIEGNGSADQIGRAALFSGEIENCVHQNHVIRVRPDRQRVDPEFLNWFLNSPIGQEEVQALSRTTSGLRSLSVGRIKQIPVPLPSLDAQRSIVGAIRNLQTKADALTQVQAETSAELDALLPSVLDKAFKGEL